MGGFVKKKEKSRKARSALIEPTSAEDVKLIRQLFLEGMSIADIATKFERDVLSIAEVLRYGNTEELRCSFCFCGEKEIGLLIAGPFALICDDCLDLCIDIVREARPDLIRIRIGRKQAIAGGPADAGESG